jgi:hypothetical protein
MRLQSRAAAGRSQSARLVLSPRIGLVLLVAREGRPTVATMNGAMGSSTTFHCLKCRLAQRAEVRLRRQETAKPTAHAWQANTRVAMLLALKRCPRCGYYDRGVEKHNRHNLRFAQIATGTLVLAIALSLLAIPSVPRLAFIISSAAMLAGFVVLLRMYSRKFPRNVESRVILVESNVPIHDAWY